jgi:pimeloyl-ACP methyl ester carboxylesterase
MTSVEYVRHDGVCLAVECLGSGPALIYAHGLTGNRVHSIRQLEGLADRFRVIAFDQRGHGYSTPVTDPALYALPRMSGDVAAILDFFGIERAIVGGESMGAATSLRFALEHPHRLTALLLCAPAFGPGLHPERQALHMLGRQFESAGKESIVDGLRRQWHEQGMSQAATDYWVSVLLSHSSTAQAVACHTVAEWTMLSSMDELSSLRVPVQIIAYPNDTMHPLALAQTMYAVIPRAELEIVESCKTLFEDVPRPGRIFRRFLEFAAENWTDDI